MADFSDLVEQYGSVSAALAATGYEKGEDGSWHKTETERTLNDNGYDDSIDYSVELENAKNSGASQSVIDQLNAERNNKIAHKYGGSEPTMYGSNQTYTQLSADRDSGSGSSGASDSAIDSALRFAFYDGANYMGDNDVYKAAYEAALAGDWDKVGSLVNKLEYNDAYGGNLKETNRYMGELQKLFGYDAETYYNQMYDKAHGAGSAAAFDATGGAIKTYGDLVAAVGSAKAQQIVTSRVATNPSKYQGVNNAPATSVPAAQQGSTVAQSLGATLSSNFGNGSGIKNGMVNSSGGYDLSDVIRAQKEAELEAKLANLKGAFNKSETALNDALAKIPQEYDSARNEVAAQYAIAQRAFDERAAASGLNSGTTGQAALARNSVLQKNLAEIGQKQADAASEIELQKALLVAELEAAITEALAQGESELAAMLREEMIRVQELEREDELIAAQQEAEKNELALKYAAELGLDAGDLLGVESKGQAGGTQTQTPTGNQTANPTGGTGYNNGVLTTAQVKTLQEHINQYLPAGQKIAVDGKWGPATQAAAGGFTADEYAREYYRQSAWSGRSDR